MIAKTELLKKKEEEGRALLQMKPLDRGAYIAWSDSTRQAVGESLGGGSPLLRQLISARRTISVKFENDPSYYLTQLGANLRRELSVLRKCMNELGDIPGSVSAPSRPSSQLAARRRSVQDLESATRTRVGQRQAPTAQPTEREAKILVVPSGQKKSDDAVLSALRSWNPTLVRPDEDAVKTRKEILPHGEEACVVFIGIPQGKDHAGAAGSAFALGFLAGLLGPERICVLHAGEEESPFGKSGILHVSLQDPDGWRPKILGHFRRAGVSLIS